MAKSSGNRRKSQIRAREKQRAAFDKSRDKARAELERQRAREDRERERELRRAERERIDRQKRVERNRAKADREYARKLRELERIGAYTPKSSEITKSRKTAINKAWNKFGQYIPKPGKREKYQRRNDFIFVDASKLSKGRREYFLENAEQMNMITTKKGVIIEKEGQRRAKIEFSNRRKEFDIVMSGKVKWGDNKGKRITQRIPIAPLDHVEGEEQRLKHLAEDMGELGPKDRLSFKLYENGQQVGVHRSTYDSIDELMRALNAYHKDNPAHRLAFFRLVTIQKTTVQDWIRENPARRTNRNRRGKRKDRRR